MKLSENESFEVMPTIPARKGDIIKIDDSSGSYKAKIKEVSYSGGVQQLKIKRFKWYNNLWDKIIRRW